MSESNAQPFTSRFSWLALPSIIAIGLACGLFGIDWGLPSARRVALLGESVGKVRAELTARTTRELGVRHRHAAMLVMQPAEEQLDLPRLVRRYLLFTDSPDEGLTLLGLANIKPRQLDFNPRMVEYGALHVYGTGAAMAMAHLLGFGRVSSDVTHYADHPQDIAHLYIAGRLLMVLYNIGIAILLFFFGREISSAIPHSALRIPHSLCGWSAALLWLLSPLSLSFSHFINPHLAAGFYGTLAAWLAWRAGGSGSRRAWLGAAAASGAATACALNTVVSLLAPLLMGLFLLHVSMAAIKKFTIVNFFIAAARPVCLALLVAAASYLAFNPYFFANL
ncbi:MAG: hypothetical protein FJ388_02705, partial [Verrucomicrobia bacterium]|nr:hypothetical protein [Verrucomicrobiota bacterium]